MCGIVAAIRFLSASASRRRQALLAMSKNIRHRGPDWSAMYSTPDNTVFLGHERLALNGITSEGDQPMHVFDADGEPIISWVVNGELYNHKALAEEFGLKLDYTSDSAVVGPLFLAKGFETASLLDGKFAVAIYDHRDGTFYAGRDHMGISPMYIGYGAPGTENENAIFVSSEMKSFNDVEEVDSFEAFPPGHYLVQKADGSKQFEQWYKPRWLVDETYVPDKPADHARLRDKLHAAVEKRFMAEVPFGVLLSGGLDSSLVSSVACRVAASRNMPPLKSFVIGIKGAPDLDAAREVADFLGTDHYEFYFTAQEALDALRDVVYHIESWEQCRASVPMFLLSRRIAALGIKMVLSGEGSDEALGGYLYFHEAPSAEEFHRECVRKTSRLHLWDVNRANKATMAWGIEARVPFLDQVFLDEMMNIDPNEKTIDLSEKPDGVHPKLEKYVLRKAFDTPENPYLPENVLWRQKEQFSDGVGYDWVDSLRAYAEDEVTDEQFAARAERFPGDPPETKEYYLLRSIFEEEFAKKVKSASATVPRGRSIACSTPEALAWKEEWMNSAGDISGRAVNVHASSDGFGMDDRAMDDLTVFANGNGAGASASQKKSVAAASALPEATQQQRRQRRQQAPRTPPTARRGAPKPRAAMNGAGRVASRHLRTSTIRLH